MEAARAAAEQIDEDVRQLEVEAVESMQEYGLEVTRLTPEIEQAWIDDIALYEEAMLDLFDPVMTQRVRDIIAEYERR